ncbi:MAG TPA: glutaminyl-peptide cyclotransferase [Bacteroidales bacterium]|nr:glutaminyl-peptide cyclotransferase [Bacteroidales bacterium]HPJ59576.1 glutaminyl-peptide cyclotransferase [Bacteroidales bacterium]HPR12963.1 glutaminyl-peptide cyclotransferase [Bacteroidales bacterium]HRW84683.1 glutaminyl-peptide cyclotransferase [Bacteroidales bacterium]
MNRKNLSRLLFLGIIITVLLISCSGRSGHVALSAGEEKQTSSEPQAEKLIRMTAPEENAESRLGDEIKVTLEALNADLKPDSVVISFDGVRIASLEPGEWNYAVPGALTRKTGRKSVKVTPFRNGRAGSVITRFIIVYADKAPQRSGYRIVNTYPHDKKAFTQGLFYDNGLLYEGTGQQTGSTLREVELQTGRVIRMLNLKSDLFGEGITLYGGRIYQVTWQSKVGFVYEKETFRQLNRVYYQTEGWGLTTIDNRIVMSDGTNILYFMEPETFTVTSRLEVYDNEKKVDNLNELEYINGEIWANIWMTDLIARIDPLSGKVSGYIDLKGLLSAKDRDDGTDVLNGIAYDRVSDRIFVTGKNWPRLFEIVLTD